MLKQMEQPVNNQGGAATDPNDNVTPAPPAPGTIISPHSAPLSEEAGRKSAAPSPSTQELPKTKQSIPVKAAPVTPLTARPDAQSPAATAPVAAEPTIPENPQTEKAKNTTVITNIPVVEPPPAVEAIPAAAPIKESLLTAPRLDSRAEAKPIKPPSMNLAPAASNKVNRPLPNATLMSAQPARIIPRLPFELWLAIIIAAVMGILLLVRPLSGSASLKHLDLAAGVLSLLAALGMIFKSNRARSVYVTVAIIAIIIQGIMIYQLKSVPAASFTNPNPAGTLKYRWANMEYWIDPQYGQGGERLGLFAGQLIAILLLTTPYMQRVFEQD